jgi:hypothetical protein
VQDDEWFTLTVTVQAPFVRVRLNDVLAVDYREPGGPVPGLDPPLPRLAQGTFALQCHDPGSKVSFRNLQVRRLRTLDLSSFGSSATKLRQKPAGEAATLTRMREV